MVLKAKQICKTKMPVDWKWGMQPFSRQHPPTSQVRSWSFRNIVSGMLKTVLLTSLYHVLQDFPRIAAEEPESFAPKRLYEDDEDPDPYTVGNVHKMGPTHSRRPGNTPAPRSSRARANACDSDDDDCTMLEVFGPLPLSYALSAMSVSADQDHQVLEHANPLAAEVGDPPASRVRKASAPEAGSSGAPASKRQKVASSGPPRKKKRNAIPTSSE